MLEGDVGLPKQAELKVAKTESCFSVFKCFFVLGLWFWLVVGFAVGCWF